KAEVGDRSTADQVFLDDALGVFGRHLSVPAALRVHDRDRTVRADAEAGGLRPVAGTAGAGDVELLHPLLDVFPRLVAGVAVDAVGPDADEQVTRQLPDTE